MVAKNNQVTEEIFELWTKNSIDWNKWNVITKWSKINNGYFMVTINTFHDKKSTTLHRNINKRQE